MKRKSTRSFIQLPGSEYRDYRISRAARCLDITYYQMLGHYVHACTYSAIHLKDGVLGDALDVVTFFDWHGDEKEFVAALSDYNDNMHDTPLIVSTPKGFAIGGWDGMYSPCGAPRKVLSKKQRIRIADSQDWICALCGRDIESYDDLHVDHIMPVSRGGITKESNLQATHGLCNLRKGSRLVMEAR